MEISFEDFLKIDLRIGKIIEIRDHPNADKLYVITVDLGDEKRQIVAGLKDHYTKEQLLGKKIVIVYNLKPKNIRGIESRGMLLAAEKNGEISILIPDRDIDVGAKVY
ncbi:MAG: methionine--tRNA ligase subunit beta [Candidatus Aenigmatarchaeota archaeon]